MNFAIVNGVVVNKKDAIDGNFLWNRPVVISQDIWFGHGGIPLFNENLDSMKDQLASIGKTAPSLFDNRREMFRLCKRMLNKNKFYRSGHLHFQLFCSDSETSWLVEATNEDGFEFPFAVNGLLAEVSLLTKLSSNELNKYRCHNHLLWTAAQTKTERATNRPVFLNEKGMLCEISGANIFLMKKGVLVSPSLETGCYEDILRQVVLEKAAESNIPVIESAEIDAKMLLAADEIFLASEARGIEWILGIDNKRFVRNYSLLLHEKVNNYLKEKAKL